MSEVSVQAGDGQAFLEIVEPTREEFRTGGPVERQAHGVLWRRPEGTTYRALISLDRDALLSWEQLEGVQPTMTGSTVPS